MTDAVSVALIVAQDRRDERTERANQRRGEGEVR